MHILALFSPFLSFLIVSIFGRYFGLVGVAMLTSGSIGLSLLLSVFMLYDVLFNANIYFYTFFAWMDVGIFSLTWTFLFDQLTIVMFFVVTFVSFFVHVYSVEYMNGDPHHSRFMAYLSLFTFFMLILVSSGNFVQLFLGWEGVGLASYLLINFWFTRTQANKSSLKAVFVNRIGDFFIGMALILIFYVYKSLDFSIVFSVVHSYHNFPFLFVGTEFNVITFIALFIFLGAVGKSAQLGLHTWLPDAMEGPTPVSALIHAATMVTAGVFVLIRSSCIFEYVPVVLLLIIVMGSLTALFGATVAVFQNDIKKIIAYSTCSQLGYMVFCCGLSAYNVAFFHLFNHAFFKALLFLSAGSIIHSLSDEQDLRKMGGFFSMLPVTYLMFLIGSISLMGFPFLTGFYSKDLILELSFSSFSSFALFSYALGVTSAFFTAFYSIRLLYLSFFNSPNSYKSIIKSVHESSIFIVLPLLGLCFGSIFFGFIFKDLFVGMGSDFWGSSIFINFYSVKVLESEYLPTQVKLIPIFFSFLGMILSYFFVYGLNSFSYAIYPLEHFFNKKWFFDYFYNYHLATKFFSFSNYVGFNLIDRGFIELVGPQGFLNFVRRMWFSISHYIQTGYLFHYFHLFIVGLVVLSFIFIFYSFFSFPLFYFFAFFLYLLFF